MEIEIKELAPGLADDYVDYFKHAAFSDHKDWAGCCCLHFHWSGELEAAFQEFAKTAQKGDCSFSWKYAARFVQDGTIQGYLAYAQGRVVGWCNANSKGSFAALKENVNLDLWTDDKEHKVKSVVCFCVAPGMRGKGIASQLLQRVCADAARQGFEWVEAYPQVDTQDIYANHHGPAALYLRQGFVIHKQSGAQAIMRKYLPALEQPGPAAVPLG